jgi:hypothetical protein
MVSPQFLFCHQICDFPQAKLPHVDDAVRVVLKEAQPQAKSIKIPSVWIIDHVNGFDLEEPLFEGIETHDESVC